MAALCRAIRRFLEKIMRKQTAGARGRSDHDRAVIEALRSGLK
jgi:hypothetical protein